MHLKDKDPKYLTISCEIGKFNIEKDLQDLDTSIYLLLYVVYKQLVYGELKLIQSHYNWWIDQ